MSEKEEDIDWEAERAGYSMAAQVEDEAEEKRLNKRLGWILCELGKEDAEVDKLETLLKMHVGRRNTLQVEGDRICRELGMDVPEKENGIGEFEKRATSIHIEFAKLEGGESTTVKNLVRLEDIDEARENFPRFGDFTHAPPDDLTAEDFLSASILEFADFYGYITAIKEWFKKYLKKKEVMKK